MFQVFNEKSYLEHALKAGESIWERGLLKKGYGLCHGSSGNGYALLYLYQVRQPFCKLVIPLFHVDISLFYSRNW